MSALAPPLPLVYACSGCSSAAQLANFLAVRLDREQYAEMSCIAGVGGDVPALVRVAVIARDTHRPIVAIDGCALSCVRSTLARHGVDATKHLELWTLGVKKRPHDDYDADQAQSLLGHCQEMLTDLKHRYAAKRSPPPESTSTTP